VLTTNMKIFANIIIPDMSENMRSIISNLHFPIIFKKQILKHLARCSNLFHFTSLDITTFVFGWVEHFLIIIYYLNLIL